jgi:dienelactone hydrolase
MRPVLASPISGESGGRDARSLDTFEPVGLDLTALPPLVLFRRKAASHRNKRARGKPMLTDWRIAVAAAIFCTGILMTCIETNAQSVPKEIASRVEMYAIPSLTLSDQQFLSGDAGAGKPVTVAGEFRIAQGSGRLPVVVMMHGSSGVSPANEAWVHQFNAMGISTFVIDGFSGRGLTTVSTNQALLGRLNFILDIYRSLDILAKHSRVDPDRIVLMGFSRGGQAALYASLDRFNKLWNKSGIQFAGYIPFYPDCSTTYLTDTEVADRPIRIFHGAPDDYNPVASCKAYVARLKEAKRDVALTEYPDSQHGFDAGLLGIDNVTVSDNAQTVRHCHIRESEGGVLMDADTNLPFTYKDACIELNPHVGGNPRTAEQARQAVRDFLRELFMLG